MMTPIFLNPPNTQYFNLNEEHQEDQQQQQQLIVTSSPFCRQPIGNNSSTSSNLHLDQGLMMSSNHSMTDQSHAFNDQLEASKNVFFDGESLSYGAQVNSTDTYGSHQNHDLFIFKQQQEDQEQNNLNDGGGGVSTDNINGSSLRWMSSKMRIMRKMINSNGPKTDPRGGSKIISSSNSSDQTAPNNNNNNVIRTCSDCNTTRTPLWRSGPQGPKSLCNACGIRQRKARKAAMEAAAAAATNTRSCTEDNSSSTTTKTTIKLMINKDKKKSRGSNTCVSQHINKKQTPCKEQANQLPDSDHSNTSSSNSKQQLRFEEFAVDLLSKNAAFHRMFPRDEEEGALLLMALSYGLIQS
ncbi:hypothetical protein QQ045_030965 [Rhodiola kirilowii]